MKRLLIGLLVALSGMARASTFVYVSNAEDGTIGVYRLDERLGRLTPKGAVEAGAKVMPLAPSPDLRSLYAAIRSEPFRVVAFSIGADGTLIRTGVTPLPDNMAYLATDRTGRWLLAASYYGDKVSVSPVGGEAAQILATGRNAHCILPDPTNRFVFATNLGADQILQYRFDPNSGSLTANDPPLVKTDAGQGPRHMVFSPEGRFLYVLTELTGEVLQFAVDPAAGTLRQVAAVSSIPPASAPSKIWAADLKITPDGRFLYASERTSSRIALLSLDQRTGTPRLTSVTPTELQPRGVAITPSGRFLVASGEKSNRIALYRIDAKDGHLTLAGRIRGGKGANWVEIISRPRPLPRSG